LLKKDNFIGSSGWLSRFKRREGLKWKCLTGDAGEADVTVAMKWIEHCLQPILAQYDENDIFNGDETGLFFRCFPGKSMVFRNDNCKNGKRAKDRITIMLCANMSGSEKIKPLVIGYSAKPRCFAHVRSLPVDYYFNKKAWMTASIYEKYIMQLDEKFQNENRQVVMFFDNCAAHNKEIQKQLKAITLHYFPPNLTSILQPMDLGIIRCLKAHYRNDIVLNLIAQVENKLPITKVSLLQCINNLHKIWEMKVGPDIIKNCFYKAGFRKNSFALNEDSVQIPVLRDGQKNLDYLDTLNTDFNENEGISNFENYVSVDLNLTISSFMTDEDIVAITEQQNNDTEIQETALIDESVHLVKQQEAQHALMTVLAYVEQSQDTPHKLFRCINELRCFMNC